jgi:hypothetical protein
MTTITNNQLPAVVTIKALEVGPQGPQGLQGPAGATGPSAYQLWLAQGNTGSLQDFLTNSSQYIDGVPVSTASLTPGDLLVYDSGQWSNSPKTSVTDGGNF